eukprot:scaffold1761_cov195-Ochromonas_danica.AAC.1
MDDMNEAHHLGLGKDLSQTKTSWASQIIQYKLSKMSVMCHGLKNLIWKLLNSRIEVLSREVWSPKVENWKFSILI